MEGQINSGTLWVGCRQMGKNTEDSVVAEIPSLRWDVSPRPRWTVHLFLGCFLRKTRFT